MEELFEFNGSPINVFGELQNEPLSSVSNIDDEMLIGSSCSNAMSPFASGFDAEHPFPTYDELRNAGFSDHVANRILSGESPNYSQKELFECFYESDDPLKAYDDMMHAKVGKCLAESDELINRIEAGL